LQKAWSQACIVNGQVTEGEAKPLFENTDNDGFIDGFDTDNDNDGVPDSEDDEVDSAPMADGKRAGKPDWWCDKNPTKC